MTQVAYYGLVLVVHPSVPANGLREFEAMLRARPGEATITSAGVGTPTHLTAELFRARAGVEFAHVPFQGAAPAHTALLAGQVQAMFHNPVLAVPAIQAGRVRALATTGAARAAALPEAPTLAEAGYPGFESGTWYAVLGPAPMRRRAARGAPALRGAIAGTVRGRARGALRHGARGARPLVRGDPTPWPPAE